MNLYDGDWMIGGAGDDTYEVTASANQAYSSSYLGTVFQDMRGGFFADRVTEDPDEGTDTVLSWVTYVLGPNVENLSLLNSDHIDGTGNALDNILTGNSRKNVLDGAGGNDTLSGGADNDTLTGGAGSDTFAAVADSGVDTVTDFAAGAGGDRAAVATGPFLNYSFGSNPFASGHARLTQSGADTLLELDKDGASAAFSFQTALILKNIVTGSLVPENLIWPSVNHAPSGADKTVSTREDTPYTFNTGDFGFTDGSDSPANVLASVKITTLPGVGVLTLNGVAVSAGQSVSARDIVAGNLVFAPIGDANGAGYASFSFQVQDDGGTANGGADLDPTANTITINVTSVNDAPTASNNTLTTAEDTAQVLTGADFGFTDLDIGDTLQSVTLTSLPAAGTLTLDGVAVGVDQVISAVDLAANKLVFTPAANANGSHYASFGFTVSDGSALSASAYNMTINVAPIRDDLTRTGTNGNDTLLGDLIDLGSHDHLSGLAGNDRLSGGAGNDTLLGGSGNDTLDGGSGANSLAGGAGSDTYFVEHRGDIVSERAGEGTDLIQSAITYSLVDTDGAGRNYGGNVENLRLTGSSHINGTGNALNNILYANNGVNQLDGGAGNDTVSYLYATRSSGTLGVTLNLSQLNASGQATASGVSGADRIKNIENITGSRYNDTLTGNSGNNVLDGGLGNDTLAGGRGNDIYVINTRNDIVGERSGEGTDLIQSAITFSLVDTDGAGRNYGGNVENLRLTGSSPINGTGNALNNVLYANNGVNQLDGGAGNDTVSYLYATRSSGTLGVTLNLSQLNGSGQATASGVSAADRIKNIENITGSNYNDTLTGNGAANVLDGGSGNDTLSGGAGNDNLLGGAGKDRLTGGSGRDTFDFNALSEMGITSATRDLITDFVRGQDRIDLSTLDANTTRAGNQSFSAPVVGNQPPVFTRPGELYFDRVTDVLYGNTDADAAAEFSIQITGLSTLSATDLIL